MSVSATPAPLISTATVEAAVNAGAVGETYDPVYDTAEPSQQQLLRQGDMSTKLAAFVARQRALTRARDPSALATPYILLDTEIVRQNYLDLTRTLPARTRVFYAVKANPAPEVIQTLAALGSNFDAASKYVVM